MPAADTSPDSYTLLGVLFGAFVDSNDPHSKGKYAPNVPTSWNPIGETGTAIGNFLSEAARFEVIENPIQIAKQQINPQAINPLPEKWQSFGKVDSVKIKSKRFGTVTVGGHKGAGKVAVSWGTGAGASALTQIGGVLKGRGKAQIIKGAAPVLSWMVGSTKVARAGAAALIAHKTIKRPDIVGFVAKTSSFMHKAGKEHPISADEQYKFMTKGIALHIEAALKAAGLDPVLATKIARNKTFEKEFMQLIKTGKVKLDDPRSFKVYARWTLRRVSRKIGLTDVERQRIRQVTGERDFMRIVNRGRQAARTFATDKDAAKFAAASIGALGVADPRYSRLATYVSKITPHSKLEGFMADAAAFYLRYQAFKAEFGQTATLAGLATGELFKTFAKLGASDTGVKWELLGGDFIKNGGHYSAFVRHYLKRGRCLEHDPNDENRCIKWGYDPKTFMGKIFPTTYMPGSLGFYVPPEASRFRKMMFWAYRLHPWKLLTGAIDGSLFMDLWLYGSKGGKLDYNQLPLYARLSLRVMNSLPYRIWNRGFTVLKAMRDLPTVLATAPERMTYWMVGKAVDKFKKGVVDRLKKGAKWVAKKALKLLMKTKLGKLIAKLVAKLISILLDTIIPGLGRVFSILRKLPVIGGIIDQAILELIKLARILAWIAGLFFILLIMSSFMIMGSILGGLFGIVSSIRDDVSGAVGTFASNPDSDNLLYDTEELPNDCGDIYYDEYRHEPMDSQYTLDPNDGGHSECFVHKGYVSQGPFGQTTHGYCCEPEIANKRKGFLKDCQRCRLGCSGSCDGCPVTDQYAIDVSNDKKDGKFDMEIYAPVRGKIIKCETEIVHFDKLGDVKNGQILVLQDVETGYLYYFIHTVCAPYVAALKTKYPDLVIPKGIMIARTATFSDIPAYVQKSPYWGGAHVHFFVIGPTGKYVYTGKWFKEKCSSYITLPEYVNKQFDPSHCNKVGGGCVNY